jgi:hypothetical protein
MAGFLGPNVQCGLAHSYMIENWEDYSLSDHVIEN